MAYKFRNFIRDFLGSPQDPSFMIIGAQKCATSSLHAYLKQHPDMRGSKPKEIHYFDRDIHSGKTIEQYRKHFTGAKGVYCYESTPSYLYSPGAAEKIHAAFPDIKLVVILRDPVRRAYSAWNHYKQLFDSGKHATSISQGNKRDGNLLYAKLFAGRQSFPSFRECMDIELEMMEGDEGFEPALLRRGLYLVQLKTYWQFFSSNQILILGFQDVVKDTAATLTKISDFLGARAATWDERKFRVKNSREYSVPMADEDRLFLENLYREPNRELFDTIGKLNW